MRRALFMIAMLIVGAARAQAPTEEYKVPVDPLLASQQRLEVLRARVLAADQNLSQARRRAKQARASLEEARKRSEAAGRALKSARVQAARAHKRYDRASIAFDRLRKGDASGARPVATKP